MSHAQAQQLVALVLTHHIRFENATTLALDGRNELSTNAPTARLIRRLRDEVLDIALREAEVE